MSTTEEKQQTNIYPALRGEAIAVLNIADNEDEDGLLHRIDGPATEWANGDKEWFLDGERLTKEEFDERTSK